MMVRKIISFILWAFVFPALGIGILYGAVSLLRYSTTVPNFWDVTFYVCGGIVALIWISFWFYSIFIYDVGNIEPDEFMNTPL